VHLPVADAANEIGNRIVRRARVVTDRRVRKRIRERMLGEA